jgi:cytochrome c-type biogenesis protein CcsB
VARGVAAGRVPYVSMYEYLMAFAWALAAIYLIFERRFSSARADLRPAGSLAMLLALGLLGYGTSLSPELKKAETLMPVLKSNWLIFHVFTAVIGYGAAGVATAFAVLFLARTYLDSLERRFPRFPVWSKGVDSTMLFLTIFFTGGVGYLVLLLLHRAIRRLPPTLDLDQVAYRCIVFAFPFLALLNITGAIWAYDAWGRFWGWDPKETWSLITWLVYAFYLHARLRSGWRGARANWVAVIGFAVVMFTFVGVNTLALFSDSVHSYK